MFSEQTVELLDTTNRTNVVDAVKFIQQSGVIQLELDKLEREFIAGGSVDEDVESVHKRLIEVRFRKALLTEFLQLALTYGD